MAIETLDRPLRYFLCIAELGSLSKAADKLDQTQSGLSKQLGALESNLGQPLFVRTGRGVELTEAGTKLHSALAPAFREIDRAVDSVRRQGVTHGTVRLATVHTLSYYFVAEVFSLFVSTHPDVNLSLLSRSSPEVVALVENGKADLGFVYDSAVDCGTLASKPLFEDEMALVVLDDSPLGSPQNLSTLNLRHPMRWSERTAASLDHALWIHRPPRHDDWVLYASASPAAHAGRGLLLGAIYDAGGARIASVAQEAMMRRRRP